MFPPCQLGHPFLDLPHQLGRNLNADGIGQIVDEEGQMRGRGHNPVMLDSRLTALVIEERGHEADGLDADPGRVFGQTGRTRCGRGPHVHTVEDAPLGLIRRNLGNPAVPLGGQQDTRARAAGDPEAMHTGLDIELHHPAEGRLVERPIGWHRRDDSRKHASNLGIVLFLCISKQKLNCSHRCACLLRPAHEMGTVSSAPSADGVL